MLKMLKQMFQLRPDPGVSWAQKAERDLQKAGGGGPARGLDTLTPPSPWAGRGKEPERNVSTVCRGGAASCLPSDQRKRLALRFGEIATHALHFGEELLEEVHRRDPE